MGKYLTEFIGTFSFVATIGFTVVAPGAGDLAPIAIGSALMVMIFAGGHVSGGHYNPAVTLAVFLRGRCPAADVLPYWIAQAVAAAAPAVAVGLTVLGLSALANIWIYLVANFAGGAAAAMAFRAINPGDR